MKTVLNTRITSFKPLFTVLLCLGALLACRDWGSAATNMLSNPDFETGNFSGWTSWGGNAVDSTNAYYWNGGVNYPPYSSNVWSHSGRYVGKTWGQYQAGETYSGAYQDVTAGPGSLWTAGGFVLSHQLDLMQPGTKFWFEVTFRDSFDAPLALYRSSILDPASVEGLTSNVWYSLAVTNEYDPYNYALVGPVSMLSAPLGTAKARFQATFNQGAGYPNGSAYFDDVNLTKIAGSDPDIAVGPVSQRKIVGQSVTFTVIANGGSTLYYQWQKDGGSVFNDSRVSGANTATLTITDLTLADAGSYSVTVTDDAGTVTSGAAVLSVVPLEQASNLLVNRGFESGNAQGWTPFGGAAIANTTGDAAGIYEGSWAAEAYGLGAGTWNGIYQDLAASPGQAFTADAWFLVSAAAPITGSGECWLEVQFRNANEDIIGLYKSEYVTSNTPASSWINLKATNLINLDTYAIAGHANYLFAPPTTAKVRYQVTYHGGDGGGAAYFDAMNLLLKLPVSATVTKAASNLQISWPAQIGVSYQVLYKENLTDTTWQLLTTVTGDLSGQASVTDAIGSGRRFYVISTL